MTVDLFIPTLWSARLLAHLDKSFVYAQAGVVNRDYEGEIQAKGDRVRIGFISDITIKPFTKNTDIDPPDTLDDNQLTLVIDQADYFNFQVDDVDLRQTALPLVDEAMDRAGVGLADEVDQFVATEMATDGTAVVTAATDAYEQLVDLGTALSEENVPRSGRWAVIPPWFHGLLLKDDRFVSSGAAQAEDRLQNGVVGRAAGFTILESNNVPVGTANDYSIIAGHAIGTSFADQISKMEAYRPERRFADAVKGLHLYGGQVVKPEALAVLTAIRP